MMAGLTVTSSALEHAAALIAAARLPPAAVKDGAAVGCREVRSPEGG